MVTASQHNDKPKHPLGCVLWCWALLLISAVAVGAGPKCARTFTAALVEDGLWHDPRTHKGIDDDLLNVLRKRSGCTFQVLDLPNNRAKRLFETGAIDMKFSTAELPEREQFGYFAIYGALKNLAVMRQDCWATTLDQFTSDRTLKIGVLRGATYGPQYDEVIAQLRQEGRVYDAIDKIQLFQWLSTRRIDMFITEAAVSTPTLRSVGLLSKVRISDWTPQAKPIKGGIWLSKLTFNEEEARAWGNLIETMHKDGTLRSILTQYIPSSAADLMLDF